MLDLKRVRREPDVVRAALARRGGEEVLDRVLELDERRREAVGRFESLRAEQNEVSKEIGRAKGAGEDAGEALARMQEVARQVKELDAQRGEAEQELDRLLLTVPNLPDDEAPLEDTVVRVVGEPRIPVQPPKDHLELAGERIDMERGAKLSGSRFTYLRGDLVFLEFALVRWALDKLSSSYGFEPVIPPVLVREEALYGTGMLPDTEQQIYRVAEDDLYLAGTSEVALAFLHAGEILDGETLPRRYAGFSTCFRREAGAAGRDTRGMFRVHQFDKVEMFSYVEPEASKDEHLRILAIEEEILSELEIPYRVVDIAIGDLGPSAARKFDCEAWLPSQERYRELTSCSNTTDFQARRLDARFRRDGGRGGRVAVMHTLNGTAVAVGRTIIALLENGQQEDGSIRMPEVLRPYGIPAVLPPAQQSR